PWSWLAGWAARFYERHVVDANPYAFANRGAGFVRVHDPGSFPSEAFEIVRRSRMKTDRATECALIGESSALYPFPFAQVTASTLLIRGGSSGASQTVGQWLLWRRLPRSRRIVIPNAGHWIANEQDLPLAVAILRFAAEDAAQGNA